MTASRVNAIAIAVFGTAVALACVSLAIRLSFVSELPNEGWNAIHAVHAFSRELYPDPSRGIINNYPPLWAYLTGALAKMFGDPIFPGRVVAAFSGLALAPVTYALARRLQASAAGALIAAGWLVIVLTVQFEAQFGNAEPNLIAALLMLTGALLAVSAQTRGMVVASALVMVAAGLFKHNPIGFPFATAIWLLLYRRRLLLPWLLTGVGAAAIALAALYAGYGSAFLANITVPRELTVSRLFTNLAQSWRAVVPLAGLAWLVAHARRQGRLADERIGFVLLAVAGGLLEILLFGGALGVSINIAFTLMIASALALALFWTRLQQAMPERWSVHALVAALLLLRALVNTGGEVWRPVFEREARQELAQQESHLIALRDALKSLPGPVACEFMSVCLWAGHASAVDLWKLRHERTLARIVDRDAVLRRIAGGEFAAVMLFGRFADGNLPGLGAALQACCGEPRVIGDATLLLRRDLAQPP
ncbi:MAG TPA: glycosyltransferase family 39 protein [Xanthobacteraceae bacterium]